MADSNQQTLPFDTAPAAPPPPVMEADDEEDGDDEPLFWRFMPTLCLPDVKTFGELFEEIRAWRGPGIERPEGFRWCRISDETRDPWVWSLDVRIGPAVAEIIERMDKVVDATHVFIDIMVRKDGTALVRAQYDHIIGDRWVAVIDPATIPLEAPPYPEPPRGRRREKKDAGNSAPSASSLPRKERALELLGKLSIEKNVARFKGPQIADWHILKESVEMLGGVWVGGKTQGFRFPPRLDASTVIQNAIASGRITNEAKEAHFIASPPPVVKRLLDLVEPRDGESILEPSAGQGAIADGVRERAPGATLVLCELLEENREALIAKGYESALREETDFLTTELSGMDAVIMNPPFKAEIAHVLHAFNALRKGGRLASVMSDGITFREDQEAERFRTIVKAYGGRFEALPPKSFQASGTSVNTIILYLPKK